MSERPVSERPIRRLLIANRGEIACRIIRTARERGITTVAIHSDADRRARHVRLADEAVHVGGSASRDSYLDIERVVTAAREREVDAVHPGFGFLSENARFAEALEAAGIRFVGPNVRAIEAMGDKIESKRIATDAGVNTVPGHPDAIDDADEAVAIAERIGCPVMLKASAGGGGKGMRIADRLETVREGFVSAQNEARSAFGDDRVFIEKYIERPRHIEIQILADAHGHVVHLGERECSIQRRHQKIVEEAPSSFLDDTTRQQMGEQAVALARAVDYRSAGTVEFIVDAERRFYFLEMNTRLQVEHPVTECVTGLDLVGLMIDIAEGQPLPFAQRDIELSGWAFEARVYAEDPDRGFLPSTGRITRYDVPDDRDGVRIDTGVEAGDEVSMHYDPMIAKLVTTATDRDTALQRMRDALDRFHIEGVRHNLAFLAAVFAHPALAAGELSTAFIEEHFGDGFDSRRHEADTLDALRTVAAWIERRRRERDRLGCLSVIDTGPNWLCEAADRVVDETIGAAGVRAGVPAPSDTLFVLDDDGQHPIDGERLASVDGEWWPGRRTFEGRVGDRELVVGIRALSDGWELSSRGSVRQLRVVEPHVAALMAFMPERDHGAGDRWLLSPMPGLLVTLHVAAGDRVQAGQELAVVEAMKMENVLRAARDATVAAVHAEAGASLAVDAPILEFEINS